MNIKKILLFILCVCLFVGIIVLLNNGTEGSSDEKGDSKKHDKIYTDFQKKIKELESKNWNASSYMAIKMSVQQAENASPKPLINSKDAKEIKELLTSTYMNVLFKEVKRFCEKEPFSNNGYVGLKEEINKEIPENSKTSSLRNVMNKALDLFKDGVGLPASIENYTDNRLYSASTTQYYTNKINDILGNTFISINDSVRTVLNSHSYLLNTHKDLDVQVNKFYTVIYSIDLPKAKSASCSLVSLNNYKRFTAYSKKYCK